jgi:UDP-2,3-diacylglucosamine pyrophosphatase LpxH
MTLSFDLISDLHLDSDDFSWVGQPTSTVCIVAGDIAQDRNVLIRTLKHLSTCYQAVFYIDGNVEHKYYMKNLHSSYTDLKHQLSTIENLQFLHDDIIVIEGVAFLGTNGWWGYNFDPLINAEESQEWYEHALGFPVDCETVIDYSINDTAYLVHSVKKLQKHPDIKKIVVVTHTVPILDLISHDTELAGTYKLNVMGNQLLEMVHDVDTERKIDTWCFGHYHGPVDRIISGVRYTNNCLGRPGTTWYRTPYYPKRITINF